MASKQMLETTLLDSLKASEERFRNLVENSSDWIWEVDKNGIYTYCSPQCIDMVGYRPDEILGKTPFNFMPAEESLRIAEIFRHYIDEKRPFSHLENVFIHKNGQQIIMETGGIPFFDDQGGLLGFRGIDRDITARKGAEAGIRRQAQIIDQIHDSVIATDMLGIVNSWNKGAERLFGISKDKALGEHIGFICPTEEREFLQKNAIAPLLDKGFHDVRVRMLGKKGIFHAHLSLSLLYDDQHKPEGMIGYLIDISSQIEADQALKVSEKNLEITLNSIGDAVIVTDTNQCITRMNKVAEQLTEWPQDQAIGTPVDKVFNVCNTKTGNVVANPVSRVIAGKETIQLAEGSSLITRSGSRLQIADSAAPIIDEANQFIGVVLVFHDVTSEYEVQRALYRSNLQFAAFVSALPDIAFVLDEEGYYLSIYGADHHLFYAEASSLLNKSVLDVLPRSLAEKFISTIQDTLNSNETQVLEYELKLAQGLCHFEGRVAPMFNDTSDNRQVVWIARDITEKKQTLHSLQASEKRFREIFSKMPNIAVQGYNSDREVIYWNKSSENIYGYLAEEAIGQKLEDLIIPADFKDHVIAATDNLLNLDIPIPSGELLLKRKDGSSIPVFSNHIKLEGRKLDTAEMYCIDVDLTDTKKAHNAVEKLAFYDSLTNLPNRRLFLERLSQEQKVSKRRSSCLALLFLDIDHFKILNDSLGHSVGDLLLIQAGRRIKDVIRKEDTVARLGGDEFVVLLSELSMEKTVAAKQAQSIAEKIKAELSSPIVVQQHEYIITSSIGVTLFSGVDDSADTILKQADTAMYRAKTTGRDNVQFFHPNMQVEADKRLALEKDLHLAVRRQEFELYYQPQYDDKGSFVGAEALIRWNHPVRGLVSPDEFIPVAEETGLIITLGDWVISTACEQLRLWEKLGIPEGFHLAINVSPKQFRMQAFVPHLQYQISQWEVNPEHLTLELTEGIVIDNVEQTIHNMRALKSTGVRFSIDDFGTGYSSLVYLKQLPLDQLKIDQVFIRDIETDPNDAIIVETIISMAKLLGFNVIAEGVETLEQLVFLSSRGCNSYQGYYFCKPLPEIEFTARLKKAVESAITKKHLAVIPPEAGNI